MNAFESMAIQLSGFTFRHQKTKKTVSREDYEIFCKEYVFDNLREVSFARAFCERFDIKDDLLRTMTHVSNADTKSLIEILGYIK